MTYPRQNGTEAAALRSQPEEPVEIISPPVGIENVESSANVVDDILKRYVRQSTINEAQKRKTALAMELVRDLHKRGQMSLQTTFTFLDALDDSMELSSGRRQLYEQASRKQLELELQHMNQLLRLGARNIAVQVGHSVDNAASLLESRRGRGIVASVIIGAKLGLGPRSPRKTIEGEARPVEDRSSRGRFDGIVIGDSGFDDEFDDLG